MINKEQRNIKKQMLWRKNNEFQSFQSQRNMQFLKNEQGDVEERGEFYYQ